MNDILRITAVILGLIGVLIYVFRMKRQSDIFDALSIISGIAAALAGISMIIFAWQHRGDGAAGQIFVQLHLGAMLLIWHGIRTVILKMQFFEEQPERNFGPEDPPGLSKTKQTGPKPAPPGAGFVFLGA
jgi:uncharacterized membrane protein HdeD (DUF308 family)